MARKTIAQRTQERNEEDRRAWSYFLPRLQALDDWFEGVKLIESGPGVDAPGRKYYSNLGFFLGAGSFSPPDGASTTELREYIRILKAIDAKGQVTPGATEGLIKRLEDAIENPRRRS